MSSWDTIGAEKLNQIMNNNLEWMKNKRCKPNKWIKFWFKISSLEIKMANIDLKKIYSADD